MLFSKKIHFFSKIIISYNYYFLECFLFLVFFFLFLTEAEFENLILIICFFANSLIVFSILNLIFLEIKNLAFPFNLQKFFIFVILIYFISYFLLSLFVIFILNFLDQILFSICFRTYFGIFFSLIFIIFAFLIFGFRTPYNDLFGKNIFLKFLYSLLSPILFIFLLISLSNLIIFIFPFKFFFLFLLFLIRFHKKLTTFYKEIWISSIENSSVLLIFLRFSTAGPLIFVDFLMSIFLENFILNGLVLSKPTAVNEVFHQSSRRYLLNGPYNLTSSLKDDQIILDNLTKYVFLEHANKSITLNEAVNIIQTKCPKIFKEFNINSGQELKHRLSLEFLYNTTSYCIVSSRSLFLNEGFYIINPAVDSSNISTLLKQSAQDSTKSFFFKYGDIWYLSQGVSTDLLKPTTLNSFFMPIIQPDSFPWVTTLSEIGYISGYKVKLNDFIVIEKATNICSFIECKTTSNEDKDFSRLTNFVKVHVLNPETNRLKILDSKNFEEVDLSKFSFTKNSFVDFCKDHFVMSSNIKSNTFFKKEVTSVIICAKFNNFKNYE